MAATLVGIIYDSVTLVIREIVLPSDDNELLAMWYRGLGTDMVRVDRAVYAASSNPQELVPGWTP